MPKLIKHKNVNYLVIEDEAMIQKTLLEFDDKKIDIVVIGKAETEQELVSLLAEHMESYKGNDVYKIEPSPSMPYIDYKKDSHRSNKWYNNIPKTKKKR